MLVSDHNSYNGYRYWRDHIKGKKYTDFVVLKGIEYDTNNAGHFLVILPEGVKPRILEMRGMPVELLTRKNGIRKQRRRPESTFWQSLAAVIPTKRTALERHIQNFVNRSIQNPI